MDDRNSSTLWKRTLQQVTRKIRNRIRPTEPDRSPEVTSVSSPLHHRSNMHTQAESHLLKVIESGSFWTLSEVDLLHAIQKEFPSELEHLKHAYSIREGTVGELSTSPSKILYPDEELYDEVNRSLVGVLALRWINDNDYDKFTGCQPPAVRLPREGFAWIRDFYDAQGIINSTDYKLYALVTSMVCNDLGKSTSFVQAYADSVREEIGDGNHDMLFCRAVQKGTVPALERLRSPFDDEIRRGVKLGAEFNVGQLAQAENAPASLAPILSLIGHENAWNMRWMEQLLDIAGAAGHEDPSGARKLIEPIFRSYRSAYDIVLGIVQGRLTLRQGYDQNLTTRYRLITSSGWTPPRTLDVAQPEDRALMRLFCMGNVADASAARLYYETFYSDPVGHHVRQQLIEHLNRDGTPEQPAIQPTYMPGMMGLAVTTVRKAQQAKDRQEEASEAKNNAEISTTLAAMFRYLARVLAQPPRPDAVAEGNVTVIERDCRLAIKRIIESTDFLDNPDVLDDAPLPRGVVANRSTDAARPTS